MNHFDYRGGALCCEDVALADIAGAVGTPVYVYSTATLERHYDVFKRAFAPRDVLVAFAVKANANIAVLATLAVGDYNVLLISGANAVVQLRAAPPMRGRALALLTVVFLGSTPIGSPVIGAVAELTDVRVALLLGSVATGLVSAWTARQLRAPHQAPEPRPASADPVGTQIEPAAA